MVGRERSRKKELVTRYGTISPPSSRTRDDFEKETSPRSSPLRRVDVFHRLLLGACACKNVYAPATVIYTRSRWSRLKGVLCEALRGAELLILGKAVSERECGLQRETGKGVLREGRCKSDAGTGRRAK